MWPDVVDDAVVVDRVGRHTQANVVTNPVVTLAFPPADASGFSLLVDGTATVDGSTVTIAPTKAILHRPAPGADGRRAAATAANIA